MKTKTVRPCKTCHAQPVRVTEGYDTWLECPICHGRGTKSHVISDDYAYTNTEHLWNREQERP